MKNWNTVESVKRENMEEYYWFQGFYWEDFEKNDFYRRDFEEMRYRDLSLFAFPQIENKCILDLGCGTGLYALTFLKMGASYVAGQDISEKAIQEATNICKKNKFENFEFKIGSGEHLLFEDHSFDYVFSGDVFEHITLDQKRCFINEIYRVLKPGGIVTIKTPNLNYLRISIFFKKVKTAITFKNPFNIHIAHTRNNPNNEHHGLTTYKELTAIFHETLFHKPVITYQELNKKAIPKWIANFFKCNKYFNQQIIISARKPIFFGLYK